MGNGPGILMPLNHESTRQRAVVGDRGGGFGDVYLHDHDGNTEIRFCWTGNGDIWVHGYSQATTAQKNRAVRALAETERGRAAFQLPDTYDPLTVPSAEEEEREDLLRQVRAAGLVLADSEVESPTEVSQNVTTEAGSARLEVSVTINYVK